MTAKTRWSRTARGSASHGKDGPHDRRGEGAAAHLERGNFYVFSSEFLVDLPKRLFGPGRFRFLLQPTVAIVLGILAGGADARAGRVPYLYGLLLGGEDRAHLVRSALGHVANLLLMGILVDSVCQWLILGASYPGAALVVGPVLIAGPYSVARALANRVTTMRDGRRAA
jgi:hypothetical protein